MLEVAGWKVQDCQQHFTPAQMEWLDMVKERQVANLTVVKAHHRATCSLAIA